MKKDTGRGDTGMTDVYGGRRVSKTSGAVEALGAVDEASAAIGLARSLVEDTSIEKLLHKCQSALVECGAEIAGRDGQPLVDFDFEGAVEVVEREIRRLSGEGEGPSGFVPAGASPPEAALHLARSVVRRAERRVFALKRVSAPPLSEVARYLNRLSDLLFVLALGADPGGGAGRRSPAQ